HVVVLRTVPVGTRVYVAHFSSLSTECAQVDSPELRSETRLTLPNRAKVTKATDFHAEILENGIFSGFSGCTHLVKISLCTLLKPISVRFRQSKTSSGFAFSKSASIVSSRCPAPLAQLDRASVYGTEGQGFESLRARSIYSQYHADPQPLRLIADQISRAFRFPKHTYWSSRHVGETGYRQKCVSGPGVSGGVRVLSILVECRCLLRLRRRDHRAPGRWVLRKLVWFARQGRSAVAR